MWYPVLERRVLQYDTPLILNHLFRDSILTVNAAIDRNAALPFGKRTFKYVGLLIPVFNRVGIGINRGRSRRLYLGNYQISFENPLNYEFNLELYIHPWTPQLDLTFWQSDEEPIFDVNTELALVQANLERIESKIDTINSQQ